MNSWTVRSGEGSEGPDCMNSWGGRRTSCYAKIIIILKKLSPRYVIEINFIMKECGLRKVLFSFIQDKHHSYF